MREGGRQVNRRGRVRQVVPPISGVGLAQPQRKVMTGSAPRAPFVPGETGIYPVLPLRDIVVFPHMIVPLFVGREKSIRALEEVVKTDGLILLATQKNAGDDDPETKDIYEIGTLARVLQLLKLPDSTVKVLVEGVGRAKATLTSPMTPSIRPRPLASPRKRARRSRSRRWAVRSSASSRAM
jgi:ATP-dependent Lon protease